MSESSLESQRSTLLTQAIRVGCKAVSVLVLARLLTPADHGLYAMAASVTLLLLLFRDLGFGTAAVQSPALSDEQRAAVGWVLLGLGAALAVTAAALAPFAAWFYDTPQVKPLLLSMSPSFVLIGAGGLPRSQLARELRFVELNRTETIAAIIGTATMIAAAAAGAGAYAFASYLLVSEGAATLLAWRQWRWRGRGSFNLASLRPLMGTGRNLTLFGVLGHLLQQLDTWIVGQAFGARVLGLYSRSALLLALPAQHIAQPLTNVGLATLSRLVSAPIAFRDYAQRSVNVIAHLTLPALAACIALPDIIVRLVLGAQWPEAAPMLRWLAIVAALHAISSFAVAINIAAGKSRHLVGSSLVVLPLIAFALLFAAREGAVSVARVLAVAHVLLFVPRLAWILHSTPVATGAYLSALAGPTLAAAALGSGLHLGARLVDDAIGPAVVSAALGGGAAVALLALCSPNLRSEWREVWAHLPGGGQRSNSFTS